MINQLINR